MFYQPLGAQRDTHYTIVRGVGWVEPKAKPGGAMLRTARTKPATLPTSAEGGFDDFAGVINGHGRGGFRLWLFPPYARS
jgi:hypothetical protein